MNVMVAGASGRVGKALVEILASRGMQVKAGCRHPENIEKQENVEPTLLDLHASADEMARALQGIDAVCCVAGSRGKDLLQTDAFGVVKLMEATERAGIKRFVLLSSIFALEPQKWEEEPSLKAILNYDIAKFFADNWLVRNTDLEYTIVQPSSLVEEEGTGCIELYPKHDGTNPIPDVAMVLADVLERKNTYRRVIMLRSGSEPIPEALDRV